MRNVIFGQYRKMRLKVPAPGNDSKKYEEAWTNTKDKVPFFNEMKKLHPPILGRWFIEQFASPQCYFLARQNYIKSVAIMSIIGYLLGLGDRHLENIMLDIHSGEAVHVDFNCLFNKGESLG